MTHTASLEKSMSALLQSIDPKEIADESLRQTIELLLNLVEQLSSKIKELEEENQKLRDENNRLKGEQGKPDINFNLPSKWSYQLKLLPQQTAFTSLELNFFEYIRDRISQIGHIPSLGAIIREKSSFNSFGCSWITE